MGVTLRPGHRHRAPAVHGAGYAGDGGVQQRLALAGIEMPPPALDVIGDGARGAAVHSGQPKLVPVVSRTHTGTARAVSRSATRSTSHGACLPTIVAYRDRSSLARAP